jgi:hypothetical protein
MSHNTHFGWPLPPQNVLFPPLALTESGRSRAQGRIVAGDHVLPTCLRRPNTPGRQILQRPTQDAHNVDHSGSPERPPSSLPAPAATPPVLATERRRPSLRGRSPPRSASAARGTPALGKPFAAVRPGAASPPPTWPGAPGAGGHHHRPGPGPCRRRLPRKEATRRGCAGWPPGPADFRHPPSVIARRSSAASRSATGSTPISRATSCTGRPWAAALLATSAARS